MSYLNKNFLLTSETARELYFEYAEKMPIFDYHCHLSENQILENRPFNDLYEIWLSGDHYKWRLMRNYGVPERLITGDAPNKEKFKAYCKTLGTAFGNPLYHWSQLELKEFFNCDREINEHNADDIWAECNAYIKENSLTPQKLIEQSKVTCLFTTNEAFDDLAVFEQIANKGYSFKVVPAFRADKIMNIEAKGYLDFLNRLGDIRDLGDLEKQLEKRLKAFIAHGTVACDIALQRVYPIAKRDDAARVFTRRLSENTLDIQDQEIFKGYFTYFLLSLYARYGLVTELHIGAMRNNNTEMLNALGLDSGYDSIAEDNSIHNLSRLFDRLNSEKQLPKTIVFNLNPKMNSEIMTLLGCFQSAEAKGKLQYGAAWWFLDNKEGMEKHLSDLTATGHIATFVGMLTDSRSFLSYPRHHYFRRILCNYLGDMVEKGEITNDIRFIGSVVEDICYNNAIKYFGV